MFLNRFKLRRKTFQRFRAGRNGLVVIDHSPPVSPPSVMRGKSAWPKKRPPKNPDRCRCNMS